MGKVKWGVLGTANIAKICTIPGMLLADSCELYAVAGRNIDKAIDYKNEFGFKKAYGSYDELLDDAEVQAVYIPLPNGLHFEWVIKALNKKKHVLCEKPLALNADDAKKMFECAKENGVFLMEAYAYLHTPYIQSLISDIQNGEIGQIDYIDTKFLTQCYREDIRLYKDLGGGAMYDLGCYCTSLILSLVEDDLKVVKAVADFTDKDVDALTSAMVVFNKGTRASFNAGMVLGVDTNERLDRLYIHGNKGTIESNVEYNEAGEVSYQINRPSGTETKKVFNPHNYSLEIENLSKAILGEEKPHVSPEFSIKNALLMDKVFEEIGY